jgi:putative membrane protein
VHKWLAVLVGLFSVFFGGIVLADVEYGGFCPIYGAIMGWGWGGMLIGLLIIVLLVYLVFRFFSEGAGRARDDKNGALEILRRRYARGEISEEEYRRMKEELEG